MTRDVAARDGPGHEKRARLDAVGDDPVARAAELGHALDLDALGARALDARAHRVEQRARSATSGSRAAFSRIVVPSASAAAIIRFSVPVTVTRSVAMRAPLSRLARAST